MIEYVTIDQAAELDAFVLQQPNCHFMQTSAWGRVKEGWGWTGILCRDEKGEIIGSIGPTTAGRMDPFAPKLLDMGLVAMIGKGGRAKPVVDAIVRNGCVYFCAIGGAGAAISGCIKKVEVLAFAELGCESLKRLTIENMPVVCTIDSTGGNQFELGRAEYEVKD